MATQERRVKDVREGGFPTTQSLAYKTSNIIKTVAGGIDTVVVLTGTPN